MPELSMIHLLDVKDFIKSLQPITSPDIFVKKDEFHAGGLFSEIIFGPVNSDSRKTIFSYIKLNTKVFHPDMFRILKRLDRKIIKFALSEQKYSLVDGTLIEDDKGITGMTSLIKIFDKIKIREETPERIKLIKKINEEYKNKRLFIEEVPVIPPEHRPIVEGDDGTYTIDEMNNHYISIIRKSNQLSSVSGELYEILSSSMQQTINELSDYVKAKIGKKSGIIREAIMGKRVDFSGRAVITPSPTLASDEIGIPLKMAVVIFEPFILHILTKRFREQELLGNLVKDHLGIPLSIDALKKIFNGIYKGDKIPDELLHIIKLATEEAVKDRVVMAKRDPVIQAQSVRAFKPVIVDVDTIQLNGIYVGGFNADFDGDTMAIFHPLTEEAQKQAKEKMMPLRTTVTKDEFVAKLSKDMVAGVVIMTQPPPKIIGTPIRVLPSDIEEANDPFMPVIFRGKSMTMGRAAFNLCLPVDYPAINDHITKNKLNNILTDISEKYDEKISLEVFNRIAKTGFKWSTIVSPSLLISDLNIPVQIEKLKEKLKKEKDLVKAQDIVDEIERLIKEDARKRGTSFAVYGDAGVTKGWDQARQILGTKGLVKDSMGNILDPIAESFSDGLGNKGYFNSGYGARAGIIDRVLNTSDTGYLARKMAYVLASVELDPRLVDCRTTKTLPVTLTKDIIKRLYGRYVITSRVSTPQLFDQDGAKIGETVELRSPVYCKSERICHTCYGNLIKVHKSIYIGIVAAQIFGERGTQMIMKTFHSGGAVRVQQQDVLVEIALNDPTTSTKEIKEYFLQTASDLMVKESAILTIDLDLYTLTGANADLIVNEEEQEVWVRSLISEIQFGDRIINLVLDFPVNIKFGTSFEKSKDKIVVRYDKDSVILDAPPEADVFGKKIAYVERLMSGRELVKNPAHLLMKLYKVYVDLTPADLVHIEVLISNLLRAKSNPARPARLAEPFDPIMMNIKNIVFSQSWLSGLAFENINKSIETGLISERPGSPNILEKILLGQVE